MPSACATDIVLYVYISLSPLLQEEHVQIIIKGFSWVRCLGTRSFIGSIYFFSSQLAHTANREKEGGGGEQKENLYIFKS